jgi:hypothetical protein
LAALLESREIIMAIGTTRTWRIDTAEGFFGSPLKGLSDQIRHHAAGYADCGTLFARVRQSVMGSSSRHSESRFSQPPKFAIRDFASP